MITIWFQSLVREAKVNQIRFNILKKHGYFPSHGFVYIFTPTVAKFVPSHKKAQKLTI